MIPGLSYSTACGTFLDQGLNPCPLHWPVGSYLLRHLGSLPTKVQVWMQLVFGGWASFLLVLWSWTKWGSKGRCWSPRLFTHSASKWHHTRIRGIPRARSSPWAAASATTRCQDAEKKWHVPWGLTIISFYVCAELNSWSTFTVFVPWLFCRSKSEATWWGGTSPGVGMKWTCVWVFLLDRVAVTLGRLLTLLCLS